jgi:anti-sigma factor RsiW
LSIVEREPDTNDLDLLEAHLDGELSPADAEALGRRLEREPRLAAELQRLRTERAVRRAALASFEPGGREADALADHIVAAAGRAQRWTRAAAVARRTTAAAAVIALAFAGGWMARGRAAPQSVVPTRPVSDGDDHPFASSGGGDMRSFPVVVVDETGNVAVQNFDDPAKAREYANDVGKSRQRPASRPAASAPSFVPVSNPD